MNKNRVLLLSGNFYPEATGIGKFNGEMVEWLATEGHSCTVVSTFPYYPHWKIQEPYAKRGYWFKSEIIPVKNGMPIRIIRCPHYVPKNPSGRKRLISEFTFFLSAYCALFYLLFQKKFDYIITVAPPFEIGLLGIFYKAIRGGKLLYHIQDLQIDAARDLSIIKSKIIIFIFLWIEKFILRKTDCISTISLGMKQKISLKCDKETIIFPNWVDTGTFFPKDNKAELKIKYGFQADDKVILYSGAIGHKQGLEDILRSAKSLAYLPHLKFAICGSGPYKINLIKLKDEMNLTNVMFLPLQPLNEFNSFLNMADIHLVIQKKGADDLFLPSKLSAILAVGGVAVVTAIKNTSLYNIINTHNTGILIEPENQEALIKAFINFDDNKLNEISINARMYAENYLSSSKILSVFFGGVFRNQNEKVIINKKVLDKITNKLVVK